MRLSVIGSALLLTVLPLVEGRAQTEGRSPRFGITGGMNRAKLSGVDDAENRTGFMVGGLVVLPIARNLALQPEILFATKAAILVDVASIGAGDTLLVLGRMKLQYVEVPVILRFDVPTSGKIKPFAYTGPAFSLKAGCAFDGRAQGVSGRKCDDIFGRIGVSDRFRSGDVGGLVGGGLAFDVGNRLLTVGARYEAGFVGIFPNAHSKQRVLSFLGTFEWPFHAKK